MIKNILQALSGFITTLERQKYVSTEGLEGVLLFTYNAKSSSVVVVLF